MISQTSLVGRLVRATLVWVVPLLAVVALTLTWLVRQTTYQSFDDLQDSTVTALVSALSVSDDAAINLIQRPTDPRYYNGLSGRYWQIAQLEADNSFSPVLTSQSLTGEAISLTNDQARDLRSNPGEPLHLSSGGPDAEPLRLTAMLVLQDGIDAPLIIMAAADERPARRIVSRFALSATGLFVLLTLGLVIAIYMQVRVGLIPLFDLQKAVADVREGEMDAVEGTYPAEIQPLANELNSLISHNRSIVERARTHVGNLAHALKTPLAVLMNEGHKSKSDLGDIVRRQSDIMHQQVDRHLSRARAAARAQGTGQRTDPHDVLDVLTRTLGRIYGDIDISFDDDAPENLRFRGEAQDLQEMAGNLIDNACKWAASSVRVHLDIDGREDIMLRLCVDDDGDGLPQEKFEDVVQRGIRLDEATPGSGLGLSIVDDLAQSYKGRLTLETSDMGGLKTILMLPAVLAKGHTS